MTKSVLLAALFILASCQFLNAQVAKNSTLFTQLEIQDSIFFERGFNQCDIPFLEDAIADDLRFFHDQGGFQDRKTFFENVKKNLCSDLVRKPIRKLKKGSLEVFPLYNNGTIYGAIQHGVHHFYIRESGKEDVLTSSAKFTSVWVLQKNSWKLTEVLSYDHRSPESSNR